MIDRKINLTDYEDRNDGKQYRDQIKILDSINLRFIKINEIEMRIYLIKFCFQSICCLVCRKS